MSGLRVEGLAVAFGQRSVLRAVTLAPLQPGTLTAVIGPNAAGKSTLLRAIAGLSPLHAGAVFVGNTRIDRLGLRHRARYVRYVPQVYATSARLAVGDAVLVAARAGNPTAARREGDRAVARTLARTGIADLVDRLVCDLSGGQQQLVALAQGLVSPAPVLLLDEPTSALDLRNQLEALHLVRSAARDDGIAVAMALHDLSLAARYADRVILLSHGSVAADGSAAAVVGDDACGAAYGVQLTATTSPSGALLIEASLP
ncbi:MAG: ABC transporter ATP-binding protein [Alphaproteobacteria bacterium]|nr:ABC transporter ATP-binding protein [Alphaproteobacteria bacterium]TAD89940.1 MAG: ABC transporter ATP-binding protein [Alphaproteobacteria bacterium]